MEIKHWLYFGLGTLATIPFGSRSLVQWFLSEYHKKSHVTYSFWVLSMIGNVLLLAHYLLQVQFHLYFIRIFPIYFTTRQMLLIKKRASPFQWNRLIINLSALVITFSLLFIIRGYLEYKSLVWIFNPQMPWRATIPKVSSLWHLFGFIGAGLFSMRMWVQWWQSEKRQESILSPSFWWMSLVGATLALIYALYIHDPVTALGYGLGIIPYMRNLALMRKSKQLRRGV